MSAEIPRISASGESVSGEERDFATQMSEKSWKAWLDAHPENLPVSSPPDITEAIEAFADVVIEEYGVYPDMNKSYVANVKARLSAARSKLEQLFRQQQEEIERLRGESLLHKNHD